MKKFLALLLCAVCLCGLLALPAQAAGDPLAAKLQDGLSLLDYFYNYDKWYMLRVASDAFVGYDNFGPVTVPAADFEAELNKYFVMNDAMLNDIRNILDDDNKPIYNATAKTYTVHWYGGFGGMLPDREYLGYVKNGDRYDVYYQHLTYAYLRDVLPAGTDEYAYAEKHMDPNTYTVTYNGVVYQDGPDGFYMVKSRDDYGRKYTVEFNGDIVRIVSCVNYTQAPAKFDDVVVDYQLTADYAVHIPDNACFPTGTAVKVEQITNATVTQAMKTVAESFVAYEFTATREGAAIQPNGKLKVTFVIPDGFSEAVAVYYMAPDGKLTQLAVTVNANIRTVDVELEHFSTYILADTATKPHQHNYKAEVTPATCLAEGFTTYTCDCGDTYVDDKVGKTDHAFGPWTQTKAATEEEYGEEARSCQHCSQTQARQTAKLQKTKQDAGDPVTGIIITVVAAIVVAAGAVLILKKKN